MGPDILFSAICKVTGGSIFPKACFLERISQKANMSDRNRQNRFRDVFLFVFLICCLWCCLIYVYLLLVLFYYMFMFA